MIHTQQTGNATGKLFGNFVFMSDYLREVDGDTFHIHANVVSLFLDLGYQFCAVQQAFGGNTAYVQACTAQILLFHQRHLGTQLCGMNRCHITAGATAYHQYIHIQILLSDSLKENMKERKGKFCKDRIYSSFSAKPSPRLHMSFMPASMPDSQAVPSHGAGTLLRRNHPPRGDLPSGSDS